MVRDFETTRSSERGFTLFETIVATALVAFAVIAAIAVRGTKPPEARVAARALQTALAETRALAAANAGLDATVASGATLAVEPLANGAGTRLRVYGSRPIAGTPPLASDPGFPPESFPVTMTIAGGARDGGPFCIFVSSSGYASVAPNYAYDPAHPQSLTTDPGCNERGVTIAIADGAHVEAHPLSCRAANYDVDVDVDVDAVASPSVATSPA